MKTKIALTTTEMLKVLETAMDEADALGYENTAETANDILHILDAALGAMGIEITEDADTEEVDAFGVPVDYDSDFDEDEDEELVPEDFDFDEDEEEDEGLDYDEYFNDMIYDLNGQRVISWDDACEVLGDMCKLVAEFHPELKGEDAYNKAVEIFLDWAKHYDIEGVDVSE